jgi:hypothetical protein
MSASGFVENNERFRLNDAREIKKCAIDFLGNRYVQICIWINCFVKVYRFIPCNLVVFCLLIGEIHRLRFADTNFDAIYVKSYITTDIVREKISLGNSIAFNERD